MWIRQSGAQQLQIVAVSCRHYLQFIEEVVIPEVVFRVHKLLIGDKIPLTGAASDGLVIIINRESWLCGDRK
jgi:hypothetical protein